MADGRWLMVLTASRSERHVVRRRSHLVESQIRNELPECPGRVLLGEIEPPPRWRRGLIVERRGLRELRRRRRLERIQQVIVRLHGIVAERGLLVPVSYTHLRAHETP